MRNSRIPNFYDFTIFQRLDILRENGFLDQEEIKLLLKGNYELTESAANKMIENVISTFSLPMGLSLNVLVNGKDYVVPLVVEEPSIVAAQSSAAKIIRQSGGFLAESTKPVLIGQILLINCEHATKAKQAIIQRKEEILALANYLQPNMYARGGGAIDLDVRIHPASLKFDDMLVVHIYVDTKDAMGANTVNSICEGISPLLEKIANAKSFMRILSNLHDQSIAKAKCIIPPELLNTSNFSGEELIEGIILANHFAAIDPYRAATHNKGIMNGIDPLAIATGNDWRAIEAGAHAYAARGSQYTSLTNWYKDDKNQLVGQIEIPLKVGIVGAPLQSNPKIKFVYKILGLKSANELMELMASVGLAQNFAALKALVSEGIQRGHMSLHARSVAKAAGIEEKYFDLVVDEMIRSGEIKIWKAQQIQQNLANTSEEINLEQTFSENELHSGYGKVILFGEHAVVYGSNAIAAPIPYAIKSKVVSAEKNSSIVIPRWGVEFDLFNKSTEKNSLISALELILTKMNLDNEKIQILVFPHIPRAMGLGGSAALAVSVIRALSHYANLNLTDEEVNDLAYNAEKVVHGTPSGIDNTMATYGKLIRYKKDSEPRTYPITLKKPLPLLIGLSGSEGLTLKMVRQVRDGWTKNQRLYDTIFSQINDIALEAIDALQDYDLEKLGYLMNLNQGLLNAIQVSTNQLEEMISICRENGAYGAKLTGGGGGGAIIALCPENREKIEKQLNNAGYQTIITDIS
jgi:hydroxymethylglutaryl-CoA reductase